jgi:soluble cytochrome b562
MEELNSIVGIELAIIALIILVQLIRYGQNRSKISRLAALYPKDDLSIVSIPEAGSLKLINIPVHFSGGFQRILQSTNLYLQKNQGAAADFNILRDISERESDALESEIESTVALPLYIGLLGTFVGVIIGLLRIAFVEGINDASVQTFLGGVLIGMLSSACGLLLTTLGNYHFKQAKLQRDRRKNDYYTFLQAELLPSLSSDMASSLTSLKANLDAFNQEFSRNIDSFRGTVSAITENVVVQKEFLEALERIGYQQMAAANVEVFSRLEKTVPELERFTESIREANLLTEQAKRSFDTIQQIMYDLKGFREGINNLGIYIKENDTLIDKQVRYLNAYIQTAAQATDSMGKHFDRADDAITQFVEKRIQTLMEDSRKAAVQIEEYFSELRKDNVHATLARQIDSLRQEIASLGSNGFHVEPVPPPAKRTPPVPAPPSKAQVDLWELKESVLSTITASRKADFTHSFAFKLFVYLSIGFYSAAFVAVLVYVATRIVLTW